MRVAPVAVGLILAMGCSGSGGAVFFGDAAAVGDLASEDAAAAPVDFSGVDLYGVDLAEVDLAQAGADLAADDAAMGPPDLSCGDVLSDPANCGVCGVVCPGVVNGIPGCSGGFCGIGQCKFGFADCNRNAVDGCEVSLLTDPNNCRACGGRGTETCEGSDDDCDGTIDEGCPESIALDTARPWVGTRFGGNGGTAYSYPMVPSVTQGLGGKGGCSIDNFGPALGTLSLTVDRGVAPWRYGVSIAPGASGGPFGGMGGASFSGACPAGQVIVGIQGLASGAVPPPIVDRLGATCGAVAITGSAPGQYAVSVTAGATLGPWGAMQMGCQPGPAFSQACPAGYAVGKWEGGAGNMLDSVQITCYPLVLRVK